MNTNFTNMENLNEIKNKINAKKDIPKTEILAISENLEEIKNFNQPEYLKKGINHIMACVGTPEQFKKFPGKEREIKDIYNRNAGVSNLNQQKIRNVDWWGDPKELIRQNFKNAGRGTYTISPVDNSDKFSKGFRNCTGLLVAGQNKETGENISFFTHQDPYFFLRENEKKNKFVNDLKEQIRELKEKSADKTIDAVIIGGNYFKGKHHDDERYRQDYRESVKLLSEEAQKLLGFEPAVITGPKTISGDDDIFYDNEHRRVYIIRPYVGIPSTESFSPNDIKNQEKKWFKK